MRIPFISGIVASAKNWYRRELLRDELDNEYRTLVCFDAMGELEHRFDDEVLELCKKYEDAGLTERDTRSVIERIRFVRIEG